MLKHILIIIFIFSTGSLFSQKIQIFNKKNSDLKTERIHKVAIDSVGNIWMGTMDEGLIFFDGKEFINYNKDNSVIKGDYITSLFADKTGDIWVSYSQPEEGLVKFDGNNWTEFPNQLIPNLDYAPYPIVGDRQGNIYFCGHSKILKFDGKNSVEIEFEKDKGQNILAMDIDSLGNIAVGLTNGLMLRKNGKWETMTKENSELRLGTVRALKYLNKGELYIGYGGGLGDGGFSTIRENKWTHFNKTNTIIPDHMVRDIEIDQKGNIWMATNDGLFKIEKGRLYKPIFFRKGRYMNTIMDTAVGKNVVWAATTFGLIKIN